MPAVYGNDEQERSERTTSLYHKCLIIYSSSLLSVLSPSMTSLFIFTFYTYYLMLLRPPLPISYQLASDTKRLGQFFYGKNLL